MHHPFETYPTHIARALAMCLCVTVVASGCGGGSSEIAPSSGVVFPSDACTREQALRTFANAPPPGYTAVIAWANAMTLASDQSNTELASVEIEYLDLLEEDTATGEVKAVIGAKEGYDIARSPIGTGEGALFARTPRCSPGASSEVIAHSAVLNGVLKIELQATPNQYAHWWGNKVDLEPGRRYLVEAKFKVTGKAAIQFGVDWWRTKSSLYTIYDETCVKSNNCEAWVSNWFGDTGGVFVTRRVPVL